MTKPIFFARLTRIHRWAGLIIGLQIILWTASGFFMTLFPIEQIRGNDIADKAQIALPATDSLLSLQKAAQLYDGKITSIALKAKAGRPVYAMDGSNGRFFVNALTGAQWEGLQTADIRRAANHYYQGEAVIEQALLLTARPKEYGGAVPVWQVSFDDRHKTRLYIDPEHGELKATRTRLWRVYDFMWMLHIMDYKTRDNFNSWWLRLAAFAGLTFSLTGAGLLVHRFALRPKARRI